MPLETGTSISDLVSTNPAATDGIVQGDDHIRLLKTVLKTTFPSITGPVTATQTELNSVTANVTGRATGGVLVRTGQTEGSVDLCRLAGLRPAAAGVTGAPGARGGRAGAPRSASAAARTPFFTSSMKSSSPARVFVATKRPARHP